MHDIKEIENNEFIEPLSSLIFNLVLNKTIGVSLLLIIILTIRPFVLKYSSANVAYWLWLMIPLFILIPFDFIANNGGSGAMTIFPGARTLAPTPIIEVAIKNNVAEQIIAIIWLTGLVVMSVFYILKFKKLTQSLSDYEIKGLQFNSNNIKVVNSSLVNVPAIFGLFNAYLILPSSFSSYALTKQSMILRHELYHIDRHDHQINFIRIAIKCIFWFNPMIFIADKYCEADQEISCDSAVLQNKSKQHIQAYAQTLVESVNGSHSNQPVNNRLLSQWKYQSLIKERVKMLSNITSKKWHKWVATAFVLTVVWMTNGIVLADRAAPNDDTAIIKNINSPKYPEEAIKKKISGWVKFEFNLDEHGIPFNIEIIDAEPKSVFEENAMTAIKTWKFKPTGDNKKVVYSMRFMLNGQPGGMKVSRRKAITKKKQ